MKLIWKILLPELKGYEWRMVFIVLSGAVIALLKGATPFLIDHLYKAWEAQDVVKSYQIPILLAVVWVCAATLRYFHMYWMLFTAELVAVNLRRQLMNKYLNLNLGFHQKFASGSGGLISRMFNDINIIQGGFQRMADIVREPFQVIISFATLLYYNWQLTLFLAVAMPLVATVLRKFAQSVRKYSRYNQESLEGLTQTLKESLDGTRVVQSFNLQGEMRQRFEKQVREFLASKSKMISREEASGPMSEILSTIFVAILLIYIGHLTTQSKMDPGMFMAFVGAAILAKDSVKKLQEAFIKLQQSSVALDRLHQILEDKSVVPESAQPKTFPVDWKEIEFRNVSFGYETQGVLHKINLTIKRGEQIALVGSSGAGKSTLINLLPRFFDPTQGEILIGGIPIREISLSDLRAHIALVTQDVFLFSDSVEKNIWSGDFSKTSAGVEQAAKLANAHSFIQHNPEGYQARLGERGSRFSGGEKQRISIARAVFKDAPILIMDEATSALDSESELEVQKGIDSLMAGKTAFVIAHRLSTIAKCDRILVMDKGQIIEEGNHNLLMAQKGAYYRFFQLQSQLS